MSQLLPYLGVALLLLVVSALWARQIFRTRKSRTELVVPRERQAAGKSPASREHLGERIFGLQDWDFVSRNMPSEIQKMFLCERAALAISWLRCTRMKISLVMRVHVAAVGQIEDLHVATELKLALNYLVFLILCDLLIAWIWLRGPICTGKIVGQTLRTVAWLRGAFEQLMARADPASCRVVGANFDHGTVRS